MEQPLVFLKSQQLVALATHANGKVWVANVYYGLDEKTGHLFFISSEENRHSQMILQNPEIAFSVAWFDPTDHKNRKAIQGIGVCRLAATEEEIQTGVLLHNQGFPEFRERITVEWIRTNEYQSRVWVLEPTYLKHWDDALYGSKEGKEFFLSAPMSVPPLRKTLLDFPQAEGTSFQLTATCLPSGDLLLEGLDTGVLPKKTFGQSDYAYTLKVSAQQKDALLLALLSETFQENHKPFTSDVAFRDWLGEQGIPSTFSNPT